MKFPRIRALTREGIVSALKRAWGLRPRISHSSMLTIPPLLLILAIAFTIRMLPMRWGMELSEFDPYVHYRNADYIMNHGLPSWLNWHDTQRWHPYGQRPAEALFPGLSLTAVALYHVVSALGIEISLYHFCVLFPPMMATLTCLAMYFLGKSFGGSAVGLLSALALALSPTYITRTSLGFFDDETTGLLGIMLFILLFLRAVDVGRPLSSTLWHSVAAGLSIGYVCATWGASLYPMSMISLFVLALIALRRYSERILIAYSLTFGLGLFIAINVPKLSTKFLTTWAVLPTIGVFAILCLCESLRHVKSPRRKAALIASFIALIVTASLILHSFGYIGGIAGKFISVINPFYREEVPLIESVQEHRVTAWGSLYYEYGIGVLLFPIGLFFAARDLTDRNLFLLIFGLTSLYFASSMVRLLVLFSPAFGVISAFGLTKVLKPFVTLIKEGPKVVERRKRYVKVVGKEFSGVAIFLMFLLLMSALAFPAPRAISHADAPATILAGGTPIRPAKPIREWIEALNWMKLNLPLDAVIASWWDYGYWITVLADKITLADNGTTNMTQIAMIGTVFLSNETEALKILKRYGATHVLVFITFVNSKEMGFPFAYFGDDGKWVWMARISSPISGIREDDDYIYNAKGEPIYNKTRGVAMPWTERGQETLIYKLMHYGRAYVLMQRGEWIMPPTLRNFKLVYPDRPLEPHHGLFVVVCVYEIIYPKDL